MVKMNKGNYITFEKTDLKEDGELIEIDSKGNRTVYNKKVKLEDELLSTTAETPQ